MNDMSKLKPPFQLLPAAPKLQLVGIFGASAIFTALAIGSGELMFWPALVLSGGAGVLWIALAIVLLQWVMNIEVARFSLATGQTLGEGLAKHSRPLAILLLFGAILPWIWPGWVRSGGQLLSGLSGIPEIPISLASILVCALILSAPPVIYPWVERAQSLMLAVILAGVTILFARVAISTGGLGAFVSDFLAVQGASESAAGFAVAQGADYYALLGGVVFAGAGGILNLGYGLFIAEKGFGMGRYTARTRGLVALGEDRGDGAVELIDTPSNRQAWRNWIKLVRTEHILLFAGGNIASILFISAIFFMLYRQTGTTTSGVSLLVDTYAALAGQYGAWAGALFGVVGFLVFFTSALGILHVTSRIAAGIAGSLFGGSTDRWFHGIVWTQFAASSLLILLDPRQPFWLLVTSAVLNTLVMALYAYAILLLNRQLPSFARAPRIAEVGVGFAGLFYGTIFVWTCIQIIR